MINQTKSGCNLDLMDFRFEQSISAGQSIFKQSCNSKNGIMQMGSFNSHMYSIDVKSDAMVKGKKLDLNTLKFNNYF